jgi:hypothetical protein
MIPGPESPSSVDVKACIFGMRFCKCVTGYLPEGKAVAECEIIEITGILTNPLNII